MKNNFKEISLEKCFQINGGDANGEQFNWAEFLDGAPSGVTSGAGSDIVSEALDKVSINDTVYNYLTTVTLTTNDVPSNIIDTNPWDSTEMTA